MDAITDPLTHTTVVMSASQVGKTAIIKHMIGYYIDQDPSPIMVVNFSEREAESFSKTRLAPMIRDTPRLAMRVKDAASRNSGNTLLLKEFTGGHLTMVGANAPAGLAAKPIRVLIGDEVDRWPASAGTEGDPMDLAKARQRTFWNRKSAWFSSPTIEKGRIYQAYLEGDRRQFWLPCPSCGTFQLPRFGNLRGERDGATGLIIPETVQYPCVSCGVLWNEEDKPALLAGGEWRPQMPFNGIASFHIPGMVSPWFRWAEIQSHYNATKLSPHRRRVFHNTVLGDVWLEELTGLDAKGLEARVGSDYPDPPAEVPNEVGVLTMGVDVQGDRLEYTVWGFSAGMQRWRITHQEIRGEPSQADVWAQLERARVRTYQREDGTPLRIYATAVDAGHHAMHVHAYTRPRWAARVYSVRGSSTPGSPWMPKKPSRNNRGGTPVFFLGTESGKDDWYGALRVEAVGPNYVHFDREADAEYLRQLTNEYPENKQVPSRGWIRRYVLPEGKRSEALDCAVYALAALHISGFPRERLGAIHAPPREREPDVPESPTPPPPQAPVRPNIGQTMALQRLRRGLKR